MIKQDPLFEDLTTLQIELIVSITVRFLYEALVIISRALFMSLVIPNRVVIIYIFHLLSVIDFHLWCPYSVFSVLYYF